MSFWGNPIVYLKRRVCVYASARVLRRVSGLACWLLSAQLVTEHELSDYSP